MICFDIARITISCTFIVRSTAATAKKPIPPRKCTVSPNDDSVSRLQRTPPQQTSDSPPADRREISRRRNRYIDCSQLKCRQLAKYLYRPAVIIQQPTQALPPLNPSSRVDCSLHRNDQSIVEALMISFIMIQPDNEIPILP
ncbi:MAG: hypothetical protein DMG16_30485 [Acidobacteria bacterium]|nr:MAG: hypothetical protein DMG16_30485 [Acidobacteriota bacterium]